MSQPVSGKMPKELTKKAPTDVEVICSTVVVLVSIVLVKEKAFAEEKTWEYTNRRGIYYVEGHGSE